MLPKSLVDTIYSQYWAGASMRFLARQYGKHRNTLREVFRRRGLPIRESASHPQGYDRSSVRFLPARKFTATEIDAMIAELDGIKVPEPLKAQWRSWTMDKRAALLTKIRKRFPSYRPTTAYSPNVQPFDYSTPVAWEIVERDNVGSNSQIFPDKLKLCSEGVIYKDRLWYWCGKSTGYYASQFKPGIGRPPLHHVIYQEHNGPLPKSHTVIFLDGNPNNLSVGNLGLRSRAECANQNQSKALLARSRQLVQTILNRQQSATNEHLIALKGRSRKAA